MHFLNYFVSPGAHGFCYLDGEICSSILQINLIPTASCLLLECALMSFLIFFVALGSAIRGGLNGALLAQCTRANPASAALVPRKNLMLTSVACKRTYGPG
jgi:hypothetical protein